MGLERCNYCIANADPAIWVWPLGSKLKWLKVYRWMYGEANGLMVWINGQIDEQIGEKGSIMYYF